MNLDLEFEQRMREHGLDTVILLGHMNPDGDATGCVLGIAHYLKANYPGYRIIPYLESTMGKGPRKIAEQDREFDPFEKPEAERFGVICCDTATLARLIGREYYEKAEFSIVIDHHASNEGYGELNETTISEACSMNVFYDLDPEKLKKAAGEPHPNAADYLYFGIIHDTGAFDRADPKVLEAAGELLALGVSHRKIMKTMHTQTYEGMKKRIRLLSMMQRTPDGKTGYVYLDNQTAEKEGAGYEDIHPIGDEIRDLEDIDLGFTMFEERPGYWRCSFRSDGVSIDANELAGTFGGGGHKGAAGLKIETTEPEKLLENILLRAKELNR